MRYILVLLILITMTNCQKKDFLEKEIELKEKELKLREKEITLKEKEFIKDSILENKKSVTHNKIFNTSESLEKQFNNLIKTKLGSTWKILNDEKANWDEYDFKNFILPERDRNPNYPYIAKGDFDGNEKLDYSAIISNFKNTIHKIVIVFDNGSIRLWEIESGNVAIENISKQKITSFYNDKTVNLKGDAIQVIRYESYAFVIYWDGEKLNEITTSD